MSLINYYSELFNNAFIKKIGDFMILPYQTKYIIVHSKTNFINASFFIKTFKDSNDKTHQQWITKNKNILLKYESEGNHHYYLKKENNKKCNGLYIHPDFLMNLLMYCDYEIFAEITILNNSNFLLYNLKNDFNEFFDLEYNENIKDLMFRNEKILSDDLYFKNNNTVQNIHYLDILNDFEKSKKQNENFYKYNTLLLIEYNKKNCRYVEINVINQNYLELYMRNKNKSHIDNITGKRIIDSQIIEKWIQLKSFDKYELLNELFEQKLIQSISDKIYIVDNDYSNIINFINNYVSAFMEI